MTAGILMPEMAAQETGPQTAADGAFRLELARSCPRSRACGVLEILLSDPGRPFDPRTVSPPETEASLDDRQIGGLGVPIA